jgi:hypothetical protein
VYLHLLTDSLGDTHRSDSSRLSAANRAVLAVAVFVQELGELGRLPRTCLSDDDDDCK